jgi:hypothetical protein
MCTPAPTQCAMYCTIQRMEPVAPAGSSKMQTRKQQRKLAAANATTLL